MSGLHDRAAVVATADVQRLFHEGVRYHLAKQYDQAVESYERALVLAPRYAAVLNNHGGACLELHSTASSGATEHRQKAERSLRSATRLDPQFIDAYLNLGVLLRGAGRTVEALASYSAAVGFAPGSHGAQEKQRHSRSATEV